MYCLYSVHWIVSAHVHFWSRHHYKMAYPTFVGGYFRPCQKLFWLKCRVSDFFGMNVRRRLEVRETALIRKLPVAAPVALRLKNSDALPCELLVAWFFVADALYVRDEFKGRIRYPAASAAECRWVRRVCQTLGLWRVTNEDDFSQTACKSARTFGQRCIAKTRCDVHVQASSAHMDWIALTVQPASHKYIPCKNLIR